MTNVFVLLVLSGIVCFLLEIISGEGPVVASNNTEWKKGAKAKNHFRIIMQV